MTSGEGGWQEGGVLGVVVHPRRSIDVALDAARVWTQEHGGRFAQVAVPGQGREVAEQVPVEDCDLVLAVGGDGTVLAALRSAGPADRRVLGVGCGSLGALTSVKASDVGAALDRFARGDWTPRALPGLRVVRDGERMVTALNDLVVVRRGAGQVILDISVDGAPFARTAGDGVIVATPLCSSAYTLASRGPLLAADADVVALTPLNPHGGSVPPLVLSAGRRIAIGVDGGWSGARVEADGQVVGEDRTPPFGLEVEVVPGVATLLDFDGETLIAGLRRRGVIADSPRLRARDARGPAGGSS